MDVDIQTVINRLIEPNDLRRLAASAAGVANAIAVGAGAMIHGTLMEYEFRKALRLRPNELVNIPKDFE